MRSGHRRITCRVTGSPRPDAARPRECRVRRIRALSRRPVGARSGTPRFCFCCVPCVIESCDGERRRSARRRPVLRRCGRTAPRTPHVRSSAQGAHARWEPCWPAWLLIPTRLTLSSRPAKRIVCHSQPSRFRIDVARLRLPDRVVDPRLQPRLTPHRLSGRPALRPTTERSWRSRSARSPTRTRPGRRRARRRCR